MTNPPQHEPLAEFQAKLLELLDQDLSTEEIADRLRADPTLSEYHNYIGTFEPRMIEVAAELTKKCGQRSGGSTLNDVREGEAPAEPSPRK